MYRFDPSELTSSAVRRVADEELARCLVTLRDAEGPLDVRVHDARKHLKKLRALLALVVSPSDPERLEFAKRSARLAGRALSLLRGRAALLESFDALIERFPDELGPLAIGIVRQALTDERPNPDDALRSLAIAIELLERAQQGVPELAPNASWPALLPGFRRIYARARAAYAKAETERAPEALHAFRTPAKRHLYQVELLAPIWNETLHPRKSKLDSLGELLGDHHDLALLRESLSNAPGVEGDSKRVDVLIRRRMKSLEREALRLGRRLFSERPKAFCLRVDRDPRD